MGMTPKEYWEESPYLAVAYRKAYREKRKIDNEQAWLQGLYIMDAFAVCLNNAFSKRGGKKYNYLEKPIDIFPLNEKEKEALMKEENEKMQKAMELIMRKQRQRKSQTGD